MHRCERVKDGRYSKIMRQSPRPAIGIFMKLLYCDYISCQETVMQNGKTATLSDLFYVHNSPHGSNTRKNAFKYNGFEDAEGAVEAPLDRLTDRA